MTFLFECQPFKNKAEIPIQTAGSFGFQVPIIYSQPPEGFFVGNTNGEVTYPTVERNATGSCERKCVCIGVSTTPGIIEPAPKRPQTMS